MYLTGNLNDSQLEFDVSSLDQVLQLLKEKVLKRQNMARQPKLILFLIFLS